MTVLVAYATAHGSTREIAHRIASRMRTEGVEVDVRAVEAVADMNGYDAFVVGSAVHDQKWLAEARSFVRQGIAAPGSRPVWLFSVGMPGALRGPWKGLMYKEVPVIEADLAVPFSARGHRLFSGVIRPEHLSRRGRLLFRLMGCRYGDHRDWDEIDGWAEQIAGALTPR
ncbi:MULTISPECIES: flavodoxin domain-containing protein [unclassified Streptomyces]|jgi:menaquinone-dependent protoporphyrinogen oxidase|uniref:flavodoxin domain-containing protein n=1 Tax=unclassified Streptomyces TaxID=2593676 RepID=UPI001150C92E|nr:flavodoxin domain-containing protein [Streptomyces sp. SLBN-31]TQJ92361.1 menaquinone-dependent protoporphyrinogen oxidase [Streptomyces sp. SLBN-31]